MWARAVGAGEQMVPMIPYFQYVAVAIDHIEDVIPYAAAATQHVPTHRASKGRVFGRKWIGKFCFAALQHKDAVLRVDHDARCAAKGEALRSKRFHPRFSNKIVGTR